MILPGGEGEVVYRDDYHGYMSAPGLVSKPIR